MKELSEKPKYKIRRSTRAKRISITIGPDGVVTAVAPNYVLEGSINRFVKKHRDWIEKNLKKISKVASKPENKDLATYSKRHYKKHKEEARKIIIERLEDINSHMKFKYNRVSIRNQKTRWGSCSRGGNLNFNYKLMFHQVEVMDYVIIHELCHLKHLNHGKKFWDLVSEWCPDYERWEKGLKGMLG